MKQSEKHPLAPGTKKALNGVLDWALDTADGRQEKRRTASPEEIRAFYEAVLPHVEAVLAACDAHALGELPAELRPYYNLALSLAEVAPHVELYGGSPQVPYAFDETRFSARHGRMETWRGIPPHGRIDGDR